MPTQEAPDRVAQLGFVPKPRVVGAVDDHAVRGRVQPFGERVEFGGGTDMIAVAADQEPPQSAPLPSLGEGPGVRVVGEQRRPKRAQRR